ncbi:MAG TPA: ABC transporter permease [Gaiellaceae bacterium]|nr:ABC transporter permease [Gaiellaceae bacterium]
MTETLRFLLRRSAAGLLTVLAMVTITFVIFWATPTQPARFVYPNVQALTAWHIQHGDHILGIDRPKSDQYVDYVKHLFRWDFGDSWARGFALPGQSAGIKGFPITAQLDAQLRVTLSLLLGGAAVVLLLSVPLGAFAGSRVGTISDRTVSLVALIGVCSHPMVLSILIRSLFHGRLHWTPPGGYCPLSSGQPGCSGVTDWATHLALPWLTFAVLFLALYVRMIRVSVAETLPQDFVRTARAKGASSLRVMTRHVLPNAGLRILTMIGMEIGTALGVCIYVEAAFGLPGLASRAVFAMSGSTQLDLPVIMALVFVISTIVVVGNLAVDTLYAVLDPRLALGGRPRTGKSAAGGVI